MDDVRTGLVFRAVRRRRGWRQVDLAVTAEVDRSVISLIERGHLQRLSVRTLRRVARVLEIQLAFEPRWRGGQLPALLDRAHAGIVEAVVALLRLWGWQVIVEYTYNHYGDRGSVDVIAWHAASRCLVLIEVKSRILNVQDLLAQANRRMRVVPRLLVGERGWHPAHVASILVLPATPSNRRVVTRHASSIGTAYPARTVEVRRWLRAPMGELRGIWFLSSANGGHTKSEMGGSERVRRPRRDRA